ncbi:S-layer homology domain-containing protein [Paenibacillus oryzisoli]|uniref:S-layer homology domain-containing protein n=1 Tax=Paenibacillus oryzisoli TaxID=1850517 RepID=UPI003D2BD253
MKRNWIRVLCLLLAVLLLPWYSLRAEANEATPLFTDSFAGGLGNWDLFGSTAWTIEGSGEAAQLKGATSATSPQRAVVKSSNLPYSSTDYNVGFSAKGDRFRAIFRYSSGTNYYFLEFKNTKSVELWKYPNSSTNVQVGTPVDIGSAISGFNLTDWHQYQIEVKGSNFKLSIDGVAVTTFTDTSLTAGGVGFSVKSIGPAVSFNVEQLTVSPVVVEPAFTIEHTPVTEIPYNADLPVSFTLTGSSTPVSAEIHYGYGDEALDQAIQATGSGNGPYTGTIAGTNQFSHIRYYLTAQDDEGRTARYPETGEMTVPIGDIVPYVNDFEGETVNTAPADWKVGGNTKVIQLPDGNKVFNLNGSGSAKLNLPMYQNADNFVVKFRAKYERTSTAVQNTWRFRYRATDDANNNALEWATHNSKYFLMRKTTLGSNYYIANYVKSLLDEWHDYELRISGITHKLFIDGVEIASGDDSDPLALKKGYFQWNVVGGINLMIDNLDIEPIQSPYVIDLQPSGNYAGIYTQAELPGFKLALEAGAEAHAFQMDYTVRRADGNQAVVASGMKTYSLDKYAKTTDTEPFMPHIVDIGTYEVSAEFKVDGITQLSKSKKMRLAVVNEAAPVQTPDLDNESKFGLNTHYALNWNDDIIDGARKLGARSHRSGITWEDVDKHAQDTAGSPVYDYSRVDPQLDKLFSYGFNQITVLGIDRNAYYQEGTVNTTSSLKAMGDFVASTVNRYKGRIRQWEMPNEPEIFSKPYVPSEFVQLQKVAYLNMKKVDPDAMLLAGDHTSSVRSVLPKELEAGSFDYADAYSYHPYVYNSMPDGNLQAMMDGVKDLVNAYGGWKDYYLTEGGWPTAKAGYPSVSEETQRDYIVRAFLNYMVTDQVKAYEYYNYKNDGTDDRYYDIFWGITDNDGRPKLAYAAVNQLMTTLDKAMYIGTWDTADPDVAVQVFLNDGAPVVVAWKRVDHKDNPAVKPPVSTITLPFSAAGANVKDINGVNMPVPAAANGDVQLTVSGSPIYITGASADFVFHSAEKLLRSKRQQAESKLIWAQKLGGPTITADLSELNRIQTQLESAMASGSQAAGIEQGIKDIYALMAQIAGQIKDGSLEQAPGYVALEAFYNMAESASVALVYALHGLGSNHLDYTSAVQATTTAFNAKKGDYSVMPISTAAVLRLNRYGRLAEAAQSRGSYAESYAFNVLAREFTNAATAIIDSEGAKFIGVLANVVPTQANGEAGYANTLTLSLVNNTDVPQEVTVQLKVPDGWEASQSAPASSVLTIPAQSSLDTPYSVLVPENTLKGRYDINFEILYHGAPFDVKNVQLTVEDGLDVKLLPAKMTIEQLDVLSVQLTGTSSFAKTGKVMVKGPDGALLEPVTTDTFSNLQKGGVVRMDFRWNDHQPVPFNEYTVDMQIEETSRNKVIYHDPALPLEFNLIQEADGITIDGDLSDWQDAFPFHLRSKSQHSSGYRDPANLEATAYAKWAPDGMYVAVSVQDDIHKQSENAANMWKNDSVQVSLDPLNNREAPYGADDTEWGFALRDDGRPLVNIFNSSQPNPNGDISGQTPFQAIRDEAAHRTTYELKIPASYVKDLKPQLGGTIGFNVAVNDADLQNGRDDFIQWTQGTADSKNTALYDAFAFIHYTPPTPVEPTTDMTAPIWPADARVTAADVGTDRVSLSWTTAHDDTAVTGYRIIYGDHVSASVSGAVYTSVSGAVYGMADGIVTGSVYNSVYTAASSQILTGLTPNTPYTFIVHVRDAAGNWSERGLYTALRTKAVESGCSNCGGSAPSSPSTAPVEQRPVGTEERRVVSVQELAAMPAGKKIIALGPKQTEVYMPVNAFSLLNGEALRIDSAAAGVKAVIPAADLEQLGKLLSEQEKSGGYIAFRVQSETGSERELAQASSSRQGLQLQGASFRFELKVSSGERSMKPSVFAEPVTIELPIEENGLDKELLGIYYDNENSGGWEYIGGETGEGEQGKITAAVSHFSRYAVMAFDKTFSDVGPDHWAYQALHVLTAKHIVQGQTESLYAPDSPTTRAEFAVLLVRMLGLQEATQDKLPFEDVPENAWYKKELQTAYQSGLIQGVSGDSFAPDSLITREEMAVLMVRAYSYRYGALSSPNDLLVGYADGDHAAEWARNGINQAIELGLMTGQADRQFGPRIETNRAETAQVIYNYLYKQR